MKKHEIVRQKFNEVCKVYNFKTTATFDPQNGYSNEFVKMEYGCISRTYKIFIAEVSATKLVDFDKKESLTAKEMICYLDGMLAARNYDLLARVTIINGRKLKTVLPSAINTIAEAKEFLTELNNNGESYHPEDLAADCLGDGATSEECMQLDKLMADIYNLPGNDGKHDDSIAFCPCQFLLEMNPIPSI